MNRAAPGGAPLVVLSGVVAVSLHQIAPVEPDLSHRARHVSDGLGLLHVPDVPGRIALEAAGVEFIAENGAGPGDGCGSIGRFRLTHRNPGGLVLVGRVPKEPAPMSDINEGHETAELLDRRGNAIPIRENVLARGEFYVLANPIKSTLIALWVGYVVGRLRGALAGPRQRRTESAH